LNIDANDIIYHRYANLSHPSVDIENWLSLKNIQEQDFIRLKGGARNLLGLLPETTLFRSERLFPAKPGEY